MCAHFSSRIDSDLICHGKKAIVKDFEVQADGSAVAARCWECNAMKRVAGVCKLRGHKFPLIRHAVSQVVSSTDTT